MLGSRRGDELPDEGKRREDRRAWIREAKARLEADARAAADAAQQRRDEAEARREAEGRRPRSKEAAPIDQAPEEKAQTSFTDPETKIMKQGNKGFDDSHNAQAVVDGADPIIVAAEVTQAAKDKEQAVPMAQAALDNLKAAGIEGPRAIDGTPRADPEHGGHQRLQRESGRGSGAASTRTSRSRVRESAHDFRVDCSV